MVQNQKSQIDNESDMDATYTSIDAYNSVKSIASPNDKDDLVESLIKLSAECDISGGRSVSKIQCDYMESWVKIQQDKSQCEHARDEVDALLAKYFPLAIGKITLDELSLFVDLATKFDDVTVGAVKPLPSSELEIWLICENKNYNILDSASEIINGYFKKCHKVVNCVFVGESQLKNGKIPAFVMQLGKLKVN